MPSKQDKEMKPMSRKNLGSIEVNPIKQDHQINISSTSQSVPLNRLPRRDLLDSREDFNTVCVPLYNVLTNGELKAAKVILDKRKELVRFSITASCETLLHVALLSGGESYRIVEYLMTLMTKEDLELTNINGETSLCLAARAGKVEIAKVLVKTNKRLIDIPDIQGMIPLQVAALFGRHGVVEYLYDNSQKMIGDFWTHQNRSWLLEKCVEANIFGVALQMVTDHPKLAVNGSLLRELARKPNEFRRIRPRIISFLYKAFNLAVIFPDKDQEDALKLLRFIMVEIMKLPKVEMDDMIRGRPPNETKEDEKQTPCKEETQEALTIDSEKKKYSSAVTFLAAEMGNTEFLLEVFRQCPYLAQEVNDDNHSVFHVAILHHHEGIYELLHEKGHIRDSIITLEDKNGNNMLHLVGESADGNRLPNFSILGMPINAEIRLFKEILRMLPSYLHNKKNTAGLTPYQLLIKNYKDKFLQEEKEMKEMATQLIVVAALVATISFAAIFTFPGGYNQDTGTPILIRKKLSNAFVICDSLSFILSTTSIMRGIFVIMSHRDANDIISNTTRFEASIVFVVYATMTSIITFLISLFLLYQSHSRWIPILITTFALISYVVHEFMDNSEFVDQITKSAL